MLGLFRIVALTGMIKVRLALWTDEVIGKTMFLLNRRSGQIFATMLYCGSNLSCNGLFRCSNDGILSKEKFVMILFI